MIYGASDPLYSAYQIGYDMVLNMLRVEGADPLIVIKNSFLQFQQEKQSPLLLQQADELDKEVHIFTDIYKNLLTADLQKKFDEFIALQKTLTVVNNEIGSIVRQPAHCLPFLQSGRLLLLSYCGVDFGWSVCVSSKKNDKNVVVKRDHTIGRVGHRNSFIGEIYNMMMFGCCLCLYRRCLCFALFSLFCLVCW